MLEVVGLTCSRNDRTLFKNLSFKVCSGTILHINAVNGAGKTTLLQILAGLFAANNGHVTASSSIFYLGHKQNIHPALTVLHNLVYLHTLNSPAQPLAKQNTAAMIDQALVYAELIEQNHTLCGQLSAGQQQRVNLARLYLSDAKIWLLDEPFANLDSLGHTLLIDLCVKHVAAGGVIIYAAHGVIAWSAIQVLELQDYV